VRALRRTQSCLRKRSSTIQSRKAELVSLCSRRSDGRHWSDIPRATTNTSLKLNFERAASKRMHGRIVYGGALSL
jgi:hypothetical protein